MNPKPHFRRAALALALAATVSLTALAHESSYEETRIDVRTQTGAVETVLVGALAVGESKPITTIAGNPATITRTDGGLTLALAGERFDVPMPDPDAVEAGDVPAGAKIVRIENHVEHRDLASAEAGAKRTVVIRHAGDGAKAFADAVDLADPGPLADGQRVRVIRQVRREAVETSN